MPLVDLLAVAALVSLLVVAYRHPRRRVEATVSVAATGVVLATGLVSLAHARENVTELAPVVGFLVAILVVSQVCDRAGLFAAAGALLRGGGAVRLLTVAFLLAAAVTAVLSLDATVVLLTPVVVAAAVASGVPGRPAAYACLRMANSASLLLPVSNLTNLLALPSLSLTFAGFAATMAPVLVVVLVVEYVGLRLLFRADLTVPARPEPVPATPLPLVPTGVVVVMLAGFAVTSPLGVDPFWVAAAAALVLVVWGRLQGIMGLGEAVAAAHPEFALLVLALGVVVAAIADGFLGEAVADLVPTTTSYAALLAIAVLATVLANALTNLSATLLLVPLVAPLGDVAVLTALIGLNVGSGLTLSGSLANLLWRRTLRGAGGQGTDARTTSLAEFHRVSVLLTPVSLVAAVTALHLVA
ncbi:SLC13 family permease [Nocardioides rubriscoriae]|uniref:SLC13 family permease n=1 Tax=Nocardioides rubriscoriae TaxID=642762 RepID=UPI001B86CBFE|nr:SLC13 family permease [Nocardioides rubriscoriae]